MEENEPLYTFSENISVMQPLQKAVWRFLKLKIELPCEPATPFLGTYLKEC
jgi:hypothetical protein